MTGKLAILLFEVSLVYRSLKGGAGAENPRTDTHREMVIHTFSVPHAPQNGLGAAGLLSRVPSPDRLYNNFELVS
jgi:hypothetical protein